MKTILTSGRVIFSLFMLGLFTTMVVVALDYPPKSQLLPFVIGIPAIALCLLQLVLEIRNVGQVKAKDTRTDFEKYQAEVERYSHQHVEMDVTPEAPPATGETSPDEGTKLRREMVLFGYFFALVAGVILFGFWITIPVFFICFLRFHERDSWRFTLIVTGITLVAAYVIFAKLLQFILHEGFVVTYMMDWLYPDR